MKVMGLTAFAKSGKSTVAEFLKMAGYEEVVLAGKLKDVCSKIFNIPRDHFDDQAIKEVPFDKPIDLNVINVMEVLEEYGIDVDRIPLKFFMPHSGVKLKSPRHVAQYIGTDVLRSLDADIHIKAAMQSMKPDGKYLFSDVRFPNEAEMVLKNGVLVGIKRDSVFPRNMAEVHESESHIVELLKKSHYVIENNGTLEDFRDKVFKLAVMFS